MSEHVIVFMTAGSSEEAQKISRGLVENKLAYCVNTVPSIQSTYFWEGKVCTDEELLLIAKTRADAFDNLKAWVLDAHSYDVPEIVAIPIAAGLESYLKCVDDWTGKG
ncbi:MAG: divalent-cation tolerance protein CutA [Candidatus Nitrohelix vancouverensis]|uniref:Divalent-cation tolerance protein CutA n=1 Tax=Candidatus Nitrohelix vancouverensis TaxID=2705534 RepID=A0A7T0BZZ7_9BACT|nr:MAG: divalent-cation tolerance protein CutA [Candidatus Nitrohelix vancouverensis]